MLARLGIVLGARSNQIVTQRNAEFRPHLVLPSTLHVQRRRYRSAIIRSAEKTMLTWQDVGTYIRLLLRWWAVIAMSTGLALGSAWYFTRNDPPIYVAQSSVMVGNTFLSANPDPFQIDIASALAKFYGQLATRQVILEPAVNQLGISLPWEALQGMVSTAVDTQANLLEITVVDSNPARAAAIANAVADQLVRYSPNAPEKIAEQRTLLERQVQETQGLLSDVEAKIGQQQRRMASLTSAIDLRDAQDQLDELEAARERYQDSYNQLLLVQSGSVASIVSVFEQAEIPSAPLPTKRLLTMLVAMMGGFLLAVLAILLIDWLDERWYNRVDLRTRLGLADLGVIPQGPSLVLPHNTASLRLRENAVRDAHTRILLAAGRLSARTLLVSSPTTSQARSAFALDLANTFAQTGNVVLLVDADLETPHLTEIVERASTQSPAQDAPSRELELWSHLRNASHARLVELWSRLRPTPIANVLLLPGRSASPNGRAALVPSSRWPEAVEALREAADVIIFDGPSVMTSADAALLGPLVDGVVLVLDPQSDSRSTVLDVKARMQQPGTKLLGAVIAPNKRRQEHNASRPALHTTSPSSKTSTMAAATSSLAPAATVIIAADQHAPKQSPVPDDRQRVIVTPTPNGAPAAEQTAATQPTRRAATSGRRLSVVQARRRRSPRPGVGASAREVAGNDAAIDHDEL
jgi:polysaccharide biosynthesis transport protein